MKKILSFVLAAVMLLSVVPMAYAAEVDVSEGTTIKVVGTGADTYTVTVPAKLAPGESGTVKADGTWPSSQTLNVTAPSSVTLTHGTQTMDVGITFAGISKAGSDTGTVSAEETVSVASASALFGTWTGHLTYTVEMVKDSTDDSGSTDSGTTVEPGEGQIRFTFDGVTYLAEAGMTWDEWVETEYNTIGWTVSLASPGSVVKTGLNEYGEDVWLTYPEGMHEERPARIVLSDDEIVANIEYTDY